MSINTYNNNIQITVSKMAIADGQIVTQYLIYEKYIWIGSLGQIFDLMTVTDEILPYLGIDSSIL